MIYHEKSPKTINFNLFIAELSLTLFTDVEEKLCLKSDLIAFNFDDISLTFNQASRNLTLGCFDFQIDNLRYPTREYDFPVVLCAQKENRKRDMIFSPFSLDYELQKNFGKQLVNVVVQFYAEELTAKALNIRLEPIRAYIEDTYLNYVFDFTMECLPTNLIYQENCDAIRFKSDSLQTVLVPKFVERKSLHLAESFILKSIRIEPLSILFSVHTCVRMYVALDHSPLHFSVFERRNMNTLPMKLGFVLGKHYLEDAAIGAGWVLGSLEILGSPSGLARSFTTGLIDFVSMPVRGLFRGPWAFLVGITQGSTSLVRNITAGTVNSVSKLAASVSRNLDWLALDNEHLMITDSIRRSRPQGVAEGFSQGLQGLGISLLGAVGGLARHPMEARNAVQLFAGVGKGLVGAIAKPLSGAAELVALTGQGVLQSVGYNTLPIPRTNPIIRSLTIAPANCKVLWKLLPPCLSSQFNLFSSLATLKTSDGLTPVLICMTPKIITILSLDTDKIVDILIIENIEASIDLIESTLVFLKVLKIPKTPETSTECENPEQIIISPRTYQFVRDSTEQLPIYAASTSQTNDSWFDLNYEKSSIHSEKEVTFFMDEYLAEYFIRYVSLIKHSISPNHTLFSPLEE